MTGSDWQPGDELGTVVDGVEPVVWRRGDGTSQTLLTALRRRGTTEAGSDSGGAVLASEATWHLPATAGDVGPAPGEVLEDAQGLRWTVLLRRDEALGTRWVCRARALALAHGLTQRVTIERATVGKGADGEPALAWNVWRSGLAGKVQRLMGEVARTHQHVHARATHVVFLEEPVVVGHQDRIVADGEPFAVVGYRWPAQLGELMRIEVREGPWPWGPAARGET